MHSNIPFCGSLVLKLILYIYSMSIVLTLARVTQKVLGVYEVTIIFEHFGIKPRVAENAILSAIQSAAWHFLAKLLGRA